MLSGILIVIGLVGAGTALAANVLTTKGAAAHVGLAPDAKRSCVYTSHDLGRLAAFGTAAGHTFDCALLYNDAAPDWAGWASPWFTRKPASASQDWAGWLARDGSRVLIISQSMVPTGAAADWRQEGARGVYNDYARILSENLVKAGMGYSVIRLGAEMNYTDPVTTIGTTRSDYVAWIAYWNQIVTAMRAVPGAHFQFDWCVNANYRDIPFSQFYPGDQTVDIVGIDAYDTGVVGPAGATPDQRWGAEYNEPDGLAAMVAFAKAHGKPLSIPEWAVIAPGNHFSGVGDDPRYVQGIASVVATNVTAFQSYFESTSAGIGMVLTQAPQSLATYRAHFGAGGDAAR